MIRHAQLQDLPAIENALLKLKRRTEFCTVKVEFERARKAARRCVSSALGFAMVAEHDGRVTGALFGAIDRFWFSPELFATDLFFYSTRRGDGDVLLENFKAWADAKNALLYLLNGSGLHGERLHQMYARRGCRHIGNLFIGEKPIRVPHLRSVQT